jgi:hypothetical protein
MSEFLFESRKRFADDSELNVSETGRLGFQGLGAMVVVWEKEGEEEKVAQKNGVRKRRTDNVIKRAERLSPRRSHGYFHIRQPSFHKETRGGAVAMCEMTSYLHSNKKLTNRIVETSNP